jgi:hypothetical protein
VLKKLAAALVVFLVAAVAMTASTALALRLARPHDPTSKLYNPDAEARAAALAKEGKARHRWDEPCEIAETEAQVLVSFGNFGETTTFFDALRDAIGIEVRLYSTLRGKGVENRSERKLLARFERSIRYDRAALEQLQREPTEARFKRWVVASQRHNAGMSDLSKKIGARSCVEYFGN